MQLREITTNQNFKSKSIGLDDCTRGPSHDNKYDKITKQNQAIQYKAIGWRKRYGDYPSWELKDSLVWWLG